MNAIGTQVSHEPFGRYTWRRQQVETRGACDWCCNTNRNGKLFRYGTEPDDRPGTVNWQNHVFCSIGCMRSYCGL